LLLRLSTLTNPSASLYNEFLDGFEHVRLRKFRLSLLGAGRSIPAQGRKAAVAYGISRSIGQRSTWSAGHGL
jgi:hypothetical protein